MRTKRVIDIRRIDDALNWARESDASLDENDYIGGYRALLNLFTKKLDLTNLLDARAGAYAVYGWMPTILKQWEEPDILPLLEFAQSWKDNKQRRQALIALRKQKCILQSINGSTVGTSKFLHFVAPDIFPIWDSRIALAFDVSHRINDPDIYLEYCETIHSHLAGGEIDWPKEIQKLSENSDGKASEVRKLELCLFAYGKKKAKDRREEKKLAKLALTASASCTSRDAG
jgi:hypothetical protein